MASSRTYLLFVPTGAKEPLPVVLMFHGGGGNARQAERFSKFDELAQKEGFVVVYPESIEGHWNDGRGAQMMRARRENIDDVKFVRSIVNDVAKDHKIDRGRVFSTGVSNGGFISHRLAADASDLVAAIAPVVGGIAAPIAEKFKPKYPVSILIIQGDADRVVPYHGGDVALLGGQSRGKLIDTDETLAKYLALNGNQGEPVVTTLDTGPNDPVKVEARKYADGPGGVKTYLYIMHNGGHTWPTKAEGRQRQSRASARTCRRANWCGIFSRVARRGSWRRSE